MTIACRVEQYEISGAHREWSVDLDSVGIEGLLATLQKA